MAEYEHKKIEEKWQKYWEKNGIYKDYSRKDKFYALDMFPYPSGAGLHVGHPKGYIATDVFSHYKMLNGFSVLHPMGWDAFGLPAENYAIANKIHPRLAVEENIKTFKRQLSKFGFTYDWGREINTTDPEYYKWTQWIFLKMFEKGLAYQSEEPINWCPKCKTGLALEDLEGGACERCGTPVEQKKMRQWVLKMTVYADRLLYDLDKEKLDWEESILEQQRNWIGRSEGAQFSMKVIPNPNSEESPANAGNGLGQAERSLVGARDDKLYLSVFTTRLDTIFGMTFALIAPEHELVERLKPQITNWSEVEKYIEQTKKKTDLQRQTEVKEKTGVELKGIEVINPFTKKTIPLFASDFVLAHYGTGAVMAVPAHDQRDFEFAKKFNLPVDEVIKSVDSKSSIEKQAFVEDGILINSGEYNGLASAQARKKLIQYLEREKIGQGTINYKMRDWVFSRQRYWGEPIPIVHCQKCGAVAVPEDQLPVLLPEVENYEPTGTGEGPLAGIPEWVNTKCPKCGGPGKRETNTMPQWAGSSWYYLRYIDPKNKKALVGKQEEKDWMPVNLYVGGAEHATRHLLYARFWHKFLYDIGVVSTKEPFQRLIYVGLIQAEDGRKMSKRWNNVINPDDVIEKYGADSIRLYEMFMGPFTQNIAWSTKGVLGVKRFLERVWKLNNNVILNESASRRSSEESPANAGSDKLRDSSLSLGMTKKKELETLFHKTIKKISEDIEAFKFNTAISALMILANVLEKEKEISLIHYSLFVILLSPFAPHIAEELWNKLGNKKSIFTEKWPEYDKSLIKDETIQMPVQINCKVRAVLTVPAEISEEEAKNLALVNNNIKKWLEGKEPKKVIFVKGKLINIVI